MVQVVRAFHDDGVIHVEGSVDPRRDIETIQIELALADWRPPSGVARKPTRTSKGATRLPKRSWRSWTRFSRFWNRASLRERFRLPVTRTRIARGFFFLTRKPTIYAANVDEATLADPDANPSVRAVKEIAADEAAECLVICAQLEAELVALPPEERLDYLQSLGVSGSGVDRLIKSAYHLLGLMSFLTAGEKEVRAWTIPQGTRAQQAAGEIHSDIERGFIRAEIVGYQDLLDAGSNSVAREQGLMRLEGKDYIMQEGDVVNFRFNV